MDIQEILTGYNKIAVVGLSPNRERPSHGVTRYLISQGYEITGVRPGTDRILGRPCVSSLRDLAEPPEIVDVFRASRHVPQVVEDAIAARAKVLWLQEGVSHPEAEKNAREAGIQVVSNKCIYKEHVRLGLKK